MKKINLFAAVLLMMAAMLTSCGAKKQVSGNGYYQSQNQNSQSVRPTETKVDVDECIILADADSENPRAVGIGRSFNEKESLNRARREARMELARMIKTAADEAAKGFSKTSDIDLRTTTEALERAGFSQFVSEEVNNSKTIKTSKYVLSDGTIQYYVCIESNSSVMAIAKKMSQAISQDEMLRQQFEAQEFEKEVKDEFNAYKAKRQKEREQ